jgi:endonuclease/exonuclease/phosphatase family metal-dependent hydrolase
MMAEQLTVATWNIWTRAGDYERRYPEIVRRLEALDADVVGLVETWRADDELQISALADKLGYPYWAYADVPETMQDGSSWGVGTMSRFPIDRDQHVSFPNAGRAPMTPGIALITTLRAPFGSFDFTTLCEWGLSWSGYGAGGTTDRLSSYQFLAWSLAHSGHEIAPIVVGDFNSIPEARDVRALTGKGDHGALAMSFMDGWELVHGGAGGWTFDAIENAHLRTRPFGRHRIDYILTGSGPRFEQLWRAQDAVVFGKAEGAELPPSDHYGVRVELELVGLFGELPAGAKHTTELARDQATTRLLSPNIAVPGDVTH